MSEESHEPGAGVRAFNKAMAKTEFDMACERLKISPTDKAELDFYWRFFGMEFYAAVAGLAIFSRKGGQPLEEHSSRTQKSIEFSSELVVKVMLFVRNESRKNPI